VAGPDPTEGERSPTAGEVVRGLIARVPPGYATTYGAIGRAAAAAGAPIGGARTVAWILASLKSGEAVPWHRVVGAGGAILLPDRRGALQRSRLREEGVRLVRGAVASDQLLDELDLLSPGPRRTRKRRPPARTAPGTKR
jgi:methylated-DNA-protein-cysteine methyltransferase-like protein